MDKSYLYNPFYSNKKSVTSYNTVSKPKNSYSNPSASTSTMKPKNSYSNPSASTSTMKPKKSYSNPSASTSTMKPKNSKSKIKWNQIIILVLILGVIGVIVYFVADAFKQKCPDPEFPIYDQNTGKCTKDCNFDYQYYDYLTQECLDNEPCLKGEIPHKDMCDTGYSCGALNYGGIDNCVCGPTCPDNSVRINCDTRECTQCVDPNHSLCGNQCCPIEQCTSTNVKDGICCPEERRYYDMNGETKCCNIGELQNDNKDGCITACSIGANTITYNDFNAMVVQVIVDISANEGIAKCESKENT